MEMTRSGLIASGFTEEQADAIVAAHKSAINGKYVPKGRFDELNDRMKEAEDRAARFETFERKNTELTSRVSELEASLKASNEAHENALNTERIKFALSSEMSGKVQDTDIVSSLLDMSKISIKDGKLEGFAEQFSALKKDKPFLFVDAETKQAKEQTGSGVSIFGAEPRMSAQIGAASKASESENFGAELAKSLLSNQSRIAKGEQSYFASF